MKNAIKVLSLSALFMCFLSACTLGDKGEEGRTDSAVVDTTTHSNPDAGHRGTGVDTNKPVHTKETSIIKDTMGTDTTDRQKKP